MESTPPNPSPPAPRVHWALVLACLAVAAIYAAMIDLKGISTDEGMRMAIINGNSQYRPDGVSPEATWENLLEINFANAYQPAYFLIQNSLMRLTGRHSDVFFRSVNIGFLLVCLAGLLVLSARWRLTSRLFLLGLFSFNAFLFMHVLQIREYIVGLAFYIWSSWLALHLQARRLDRPWTDLAWFGAYGLLLTFGYFVQSWVIFPAVAQGLFLVLRRHGDLLRYYAHLAFSYTIVLCATLPYLRANQQKVNVGLWAREHTPILADINVGFHLLLAGHMPGVSAFTEFLFWFWLVAAVAAAGWALTRRTAPVPLGAATADAPRQARLMLFCIGLSLAFQVAYALKVENLSLWPRYFIIHYFFLMWLLALGFATLDELRGAPASPPRLRRGLTGVLAAFAVLLAGSAVYQARSYHANPYLDTGVSGPDDWRVVAAQVAQLLQPGDVVVTPDYIIRGTLTFTHPMANRVITQPELDQADLTRARRLLYLEPERFRAGRNELFTHVGARNFGRMQAISLHTADGKDVLSAWSVVIFTRD